MIAPPRSRWRSAVPDAMPARRTGTEPVSECDAGVPAKPGGDNVGCGDAFLAILIHGLTSGWELAASGAAASRYAAAVAGETGATPLFDPELVSSWLEPA